MHKSFDLFSSQLHDFFKQSYVQFSLLLIFLEEGL
jgi:hypothetical protein